MARLSRYLVGLFSAEAAALFAVAAFLLYLTQLLRLFDVVSGKGQSLFTLLGQAALGMPGLAIVFLYICLAIGLGRSLRNLQATSELGVIHTNRLLPALMRSIINYAIGGAIIVLVIAHIVDPISVNAANKWTASIAADLVSRSMVPHKFAELVSGVSSVIGARDANGNITDFFADDRRSTEQRRTYFAKSAVIVRDTKGYILRLHDGAVQYFTADNRFSQVAFAQYDLPLDNLTGNGAVSNSMGQVSSLDILANHDTSPEAITALLARTGEGLRVIGVCLFIGAIAAFPTGKRRRFEIPIELTVLLVAFAERAITSYLAVGPGIVHAATGSILLILIATVVLIVRLRVFRPVRIRRQPA